MSLARFLNGINLRGNTMITDFRAIVPNIITKSVKEKKFKMEPKHAVVSHLKNFFILHRVN